MSGFRIWMMLLACLVDFASGRHRRWLQHARTSRASAPAATRLRAVRVRAR